MWTEYFLERLEFFRKTDYKESLTQSIIKWLHIAAWGKPFKDGSNQFPLKQSAARPWKTLQSHTLMQCSLDTVFTLAGIIQLELVLLVLISALSSSLYFSSLSLFWSCGTWTCYRGLLQSLTKVEVVCFSTTAVKKNISLLHYTVMFHFVSILYRSAQACRPPKQHSFSPPLLSLKTEQLINCTVISSAEAAVVVEHKHPLLSWK